MRIAPAVVFLGLLSVACSPQGEKVSLRSSANPGLAGAAAGLDATPEPENRSVAKVAAAEGEEPAATPPPPEGAVIPNQPDPEEIHILGVSQSGDGCEEGSVASNISPDALAFTMLFDSFVAELSLGATAPVRKTCEVRVRLHYPAGWTVAVAAVDVRGYASLAGTSASHHFTAAVDGNAQSEDLVTEFGPNFDANWTIHHDVPVEAQVFTPCASEGVLVLKNEVLLTAQTEEAQGLFAIDSVDGEFTNKYRLQWEPCAPKPLPPEPTDLKAQGVGPYSVHLRWASGGQTTTGFLLVHAKAGQLPETCDGGENLGDVLSHEVLALLPETDYEFRLCSVDQDGSMSAGVVLAAKTTAATCGKWLTNAREPLDVNDDGHISPIDALLVINYLNSADRFDVRETDVAPPYLDTNGDCNISPLDVLVVINWLNQHAGQ